MTGEPWRAGRRGGFTLIEVLISTVLLSFLILLAGTVTRGSMSSTARSVALDTANGRTQRALDRARAHLASASLATLEAALPGDPALLPMADDVACDNIAFRQVVGFAAGAPLLDPDPAELPMRLWLQADSGSGSGGTLWFDDGTQAAPIAGEVVSLDITKSGRRLAIVIGFARPDAKQFATTGLSVALVVP